MRGSRIAPSFVLSGVTAVAVATGACATNPATGKREIMLVSEDQEVAMGREAAAQVPSVYGLYEDGELNAYVASLGREIAARSERPKLPWSFQVVDDASVNAFALPGGYIYVTRGLLTHLDSEAELVMVLGHEVGHVTARHSASQMSKAQLATLGFGIGMIAVPELQRFGGLGETGLGLLFLKFGRDDERQADDLGLRYTSLLAYDPDESARAMDLLDRVSRASGDGRMPGWLATHPDPGDRYQALLASIREQRLRGEKVNRAAFLRQIDGVVFGEDPREGYFEGDTFLHPGMRFQMQVPRGFKGQNTKQAVVAASPQGDAVVQLTLAQARSAEEAARAFARGSNVEPVDMRRGDLNGLPAVEGGFRAVSGQTPVSGFASFVEMGGRVFQLLGYTASADWSRYGRALRESVSSFEPLRDRSALSAEPRRIEVVTPDRDMTAAELARRYRSTASPDTIALINQVDAGASLRGGQPVKLVVGGREPSRAAEVR
jgi:predicted Zn-dependent protease